MGYKDLTVDEQPEYDSEKQYLQPEFEETDTEVIQHWVVCDVEENKNEETN